MNLQITIPVGEWLEGTDERVGLFIGKRVELTAAHTPPWSETLYGVTHTMLYFNNHPPKSATKRAFVQIRLLPESVS